MEFLKWKEKIPGSEFRNLEFKFHMFHSLCNANISEANISEEQVSISPSQSLHVKTKHHFITHMVQSIRTCKLLIRSRHCSSTLIRAEYNTVLNNLHRLTVSTSSEFKEIRNGVINKQLWADQHVTRFYSDCGWMVRLMTEGLRVWIPDPAWLMCSCTRHLTLKFHSK